MKTKLCSAPLLAVAAGLVFLSASVVDARTFKSANGSSELEGEIMGVQDTAEGRVLDFQRTDGKRLKFLASALSEEDQAYIDSVAQKFAAARSLRARIDDVEERGDGVERSGRKIVTTDHAFAIDFSNTGNVAIDGLEVEYQIFYRKDNRVGKLDHERSDQSEFGDIELPAIEPGKSVVLTTDAIQLVSNKVNRGGPG